MDKDCAPKTANEEELLEVTAENVIVINGLSETMTEKDLTTIFSAYGAIKDINLLGSSDGYDFAARITFFSSHDVTRIMEASERKEICFDSKPLIISNMSNGISPIEMLPDECLSMIFKTMEYGSHRLECEGVSHRWKNVAKSSWSDYKSHDETFEETNNTEFKPILSRCGRNLTELILTFDNYTHPYLKFIINRCPNLQKLQMFCIDALPVSFIDHLAEVLENIPNLRRFRLYGRIKNLQKCHDFDNCLDLLSDELQELELSINERQRMTTSVDLSRFTNLKSLTLTKYNFGEGAIGGIEHLTKLERLSLQETQTHPSNIIKITHFTNLIWLYIPHCQIDDETLIKIVKNNPMLELLDISYNWRITNRSFKHVTRLPSLDTLYMRNVQRVTGRYLKNMKKLKTLVCTECPSIYESKLLKLILSSPKLNYIQASGVATVWLIRKLMRKLEPKSSRGCLQFCLNDKVYKTCQAFNIDEDFIKMWESTGLSDDYGMDVDMLSWWDSE